MSDRAIELTVYEIQMDDALDRIVRSSDPSLQKLVEERIRNLLAGRGNRFSYALKPTSSDSREFMESSM